VIAYPVTVPTCGGLRTPPTALALKLRPLALAGLSRVRQYAGPDQPAGRSNDGSAGPRSYPSLSARHKKARPRPTKPGSPRSVLTWVIIAVIALPIIGVLWWAGGYVRTGILQSHGKLLLVEFKADEAKRRCLLVDCVGSRKFVENKIALDIPAGAFTEDGTIVVERMRDPELEKEFPDLIPADATLSAAARLTPRGDLTCAKPMILALELPEDAGDRAATGDGLECYVVWRGGPRETPVLYHKGRGSFGIKGLKSIDINYQAMADYLRSPTPINWVNFKYQTAEPLVADGVQTDRFGFHRGSVSTARGAGGFWFFRSVQDWGEYFVYTRPLQSAHEGNFPIFVGE